LTGPDLVNPIKRGSTEKTVRLQNCPGWSADAINHPQVHHLNPGDVIIIPAGTGLCSPNPRPLLDHTICLMVRIDPDKTAPTKSQAESEADLKAPQ
jgi:hypothetical protein